MIFDIKKNSLTICQTTQKPCYNAQNDAETSLNMFSIDFWSREAFKFFQLWDDFQELQIHENIGKIRENQGKSTKIHVLDFWNRETPLQML